VKVEAYLFDFGRQQFLLGAFVAGHLANQLVELVLAQKVANVTFNELTSLGSSSESRLASDSRGAAIRCREGGATRGHVDMLERRRLHILVDGHLGD
jgi:hypothetical protein